MAKLALARLTNRKILRISGPDCYSYLQGLLSNDLRFMYEPDRIPRRKHATNSPNAMSSFMLNAQGRAICDMILYRTQSTRYECQFLPPGQATEHDELLIECDSSLASGLANTLYGYRVRRKISLSIEEGLAIWALYPDAMRSKPDLTSESQLVPSCLLDSKEIVSQVSTVVRDPRLDIMGMRILSQDAEFQKVKNTIQSLIDADIKEASLTDYTLHRYTVGVGEGPKDHPESNCLPLECNADYLGSVSFTKGCYLGQELTSRIYHMGVVRKRLMPITLDLDSEAIETGYPPILAGSELVDSEKRVGILRNAVRGKALALIRHGLIKDSSQLTHEGTKAKVFVHRPYWWDQI